MKKAALLIGINKYKGAPLRGCVNDIRAWLEILTERFGVPPADTYTLIDGQATRTGILAGLQWLAAQGADVAYFFFSGHGTRIPDRDGDELRQMGGTGFDQAIVPVDYARNGLILDDDLAAVYWTFPPETRLVVQLDSCFSARAERGITARAEEIYARHVQRRVPRVLPARLLPDELVLREQVRRETRAAIPIRRNLIHVSGCRDFETSADAHLAGRWQGALSYHMAQALQRLDAGASYSEVLEEARNGLRGDGFAQLPQLTGPAQWLRLPAYT